MLITKLGCMKEYNFKRKQIFDRREEVFFQDPEVCTSEANGNVISYAVGFYPTSKQDSTKWNQDRRRE